MSICPALRRGDNIFICGYTDEPADPDLCYSESYVACRIYNEHERAGRTMCNIILGKGVGEELENAIINARERILVSSPWIGRWYAKKLAEKALEGVKVFVITSGDEKNRESVEILRRAMERRRAGEGVVTRDIRRSRKRKAVVEEIVNEEPVKPSARKMAIVAVVSTLSFVAAYYLSGYPSLFYVTAAFSAIAGLSVAYIVAKVVSYFNERLARRKIEVVDHAKTDVGTSAELVADGEVGLMINDLVHAKLYIIDGRAWLGSANLTKTGLRENYETLVEIDVKTAEMMFTRLWKSMGS